MTPESKAKLEQIKAALKAEEDASKLMADEVKTLAKAKADEKADKKAKKQAYDALIEENKAATTVTKLSAVMDKLLKELAK